MVETENAMKSVVSLSFVRSPPPFIKSLAQTTHKYSFLGAAMQMFANSLHLLPFDFKLK